MRKKRETGLLVAPKSISRRSQVACLWAFISFLSQSFFFVFRLLQLIFISNRVHQHSPAVEGRRWGRVEILLKS